MGDAVWVNRQADSGWLGFDLREVMSAVGPHPGLDWYLFDAYFNCDVTSVWPEGVDVEHRTASPSGLRVTWDLMERLAAACGQIIDGYFRGFDDSGRAQLQLAVIDSSYWTVWSRDPSVLEAVRDAFNGAEDYVEPEPPALTQPAR